MELLSEEEGVNMSLILAALSDRRAGARDL